VRIFHFLDSKQSLLVVWLMLLSLSAFAADTSAVESLERWYVVRSEGKKIGHLKQTQSVQDGIATLTDTMSIELTRSGQTMSLYQETQTRESLTDGPLSFSSRVQASGMQAELNATRNAAGAFDIREKVAGVEHQRTLKVEPDVLFPYALLQKVDSMDLKPGSKFSLRAFDVSTESALTLETEILSKAMRKTFQGEQELLQVRQSMKVSQSTVDSLSWVNAEFEPLEVNTEIAGLKLEMQAASAARALSENDTLEIFEPQLVQSPRPLKISEQNKPVRWTFSYLRPTQALPANTDEQRVETAGKGFSTLVCARCGSEAKLSVDQLKTYTQASAWLQSDTAELRNAAAKAVGKTTKRSAADTMRKLQTFVATHLKDKTLTVGFASALEAYKTQSGDCTEHALLLAALGRAQGVPTRVVAGLAYVDRYAGKRGVFVPHAWTQAHIDGHWQSFDAALGAFSSGHVVLSLDGDNPTSFSDAISLLGNVRVDKVDVLERAR
jgi:hypothetical protein